jgi:hypothetical protein
LNDFRHGGVNITGFSVVDYHDLNTIKILSDLTQSSEPLNKISNIPVSFAICVCLQTGFFFNQLFFQHDAALLIDALVYFSKKINSIIGLNMSRLFGMENVSLRRAEIYIGKNKGCFLFNYF